MTRQSSRLRSRNGKWNTYGTGVDLDLGAMSVEDNDPLDPATTQANTPSARDQDWAPTEDKTRTQAGVIRVVIKRIIQDSDVERAAKEDIYAAADYTHTGIISEDVDNLCGVQDDEGKKIRLNLMAWQLYRAKEDYYVDIRFLYMKRDRLMKYKMCSQDGTPTFLARVKAATDG